MTKIQLKPIPKAELQRIYDASAPEYYRWAWIEDFILGTRHHRRAIMSRARGHILDVACGTGRNFEFFPAESTLTAVDLSPGMVAEAQQQAQRLGREVDCRAMDAEKLQFPDNRFDTVTSAHGTCTFPDPVQALREMGRVCKPGGRVLLLEHGRSRWKWVARLQDRNVHFLYNSGGCRWNQDPVDLVQQAGLTVVSARRALLGVFYIIEATPGN